MSLSHLKSYGSTAKAAKATLGGFVKIDDLPNGPYEFRIVGIKIRQLDWGTVFGIQLSPLAGDFKGVTADYDAVLYDGNGFNERNIGRLKVELRVLGFNDEQWEEDLFFDRLEQAGSLMIGLEFKAMKTSYTSKNLDRNGNPKMYHNLRFLSRLKSDNRPATFGLAELGAAPPLPASTDNGSDHAPANNVNYTPAAVGNSDIPFSMMLLALASSLSMLV